MTTMSCGAVYKLSAVACPRIWPLSYAKLKAPQQRDWDSRCALHAAGARVSLCTSVAKLFANGAARFARVPSTIHAIAITAATAYTLSMTSVFQHSRLDKVCRR